MRNVTQGSPCDPARIGPAGAASFELPRARPQRTESAKKVGAHGALWEIERLRDLFGAEPLLESQRDRHPVPLWEGCDCGVQSNGQIGAPCGDRWIRGCGGVWKLAMTAILPRRIQRFRASITAVGALVYPLRGPHRNCDKPRLERGDGPPFPKVSHGLEEGLLHGIFRVFWMSADPPGDTVEPRGVALHQQRVGALLPFQAGGDKLSVGQRRHPQIIGESTPPQSRRCRSRNERLRLPGPFWQEETY